MLVTSIFSLSRNVSKIFLSFKSLAYVVKSSSRAVKKKKKKKTEDRFKNKHRTDFCIHVYNEIILLLDKVQYFKIDDKYVTPFFI